MISSSPKCTRTSSAASARLDEEYSTRSPGEFHRPPYSNAPSPSFHPAAYRVLKIRYAVIIELGENSMFQATDQIFYFPRADLRSGDLKGRAPSQCTIW